MKLFLQGERCQQAARKKVSVSQVFAEGRIVNRIDEMK